MKLKLLMIHLFCLIFVMLFAGCVNPPDGNVKVAADKIHIVGDYGSWNTAFYWNDGELTVLDAPDGDFHVFATSVAVYNGAAYVGGSYDDSPCYWVDGVRNDIDCESGGIESIAFDSSGRLIMAGFCDGEASVWVDGVRTALDVPADCWGDVNAMALVDDVVYLAGSCIDETWEQVPCYWADSVYTELTEPSPMLPGGSARTSGIALKGSKVIVSGTFDTDADDEGAGYWMDGEWNYLDGSTARGVSTVGNNVCIVGRDTDGACFWLNDRKEELNAVHSTIATAVTSSGSTFVAAGERGAYASDDILGYWSGGDFFDIYEGPIADVNGMFITE